MKTAKVHLLAVLGLLLGFIGSAQAVVPAEISTLTTDIDTVWVSAKTIILAVAAFSIMLTFVYKMRSRKG